MSKQTKDASQCWGSYVGAVSLAFDDGRESQLTHAIPMMNDCGVRGTENVCERFFWVLQDANYNVLGVINPSGRLIERYEYTPYGQRTVYSHGGNIADLTNDGAVDIQDWTQIAADWGTANPASEADINGDGAVDIVDQMDVAANYYWKLPSDDPLVSMPRLESFRLGDIYGSPLAPLCEQGHQGLPHDKEFTLIYNRHRYLSPALGRFMQRDPGGPGGPMRAGTAAHATGGDSAQWRPASDGQAAPYTPTLLADVSVNVRGSRIRMASSIRPSRPYADGMSLYQYVKSNPTSYTDAFGLAAKKCTWHGTITGTYSGAWLITRVSMDVIAMGTDGECNYAVSGKGSGWFRGGMMGLGYISVALEFTDFEASCMWPVNKGSHGGIAIIGAGGTVGLPINLSGVFGTAGEFTAYGLCSTGGVNIFAIGGGWGVDFDNVTQMGPNARR